MEWSGLEHRSTPVLPGHLRRKFEYSAFLLTLSVCAGDGENLMRRSWQTIQVNHGLVNLLGTLNFRKVLRHGGAQFSWSAGP